MNINFFMDKALEEANKALEAGEVPIGAVLVDNFSENIIYASHNLVNFIKNASMHAEIVVINESCRIKKSKYLNETSLFVTLEPCLMCAAAISEVQIKSVYFGAFDEKNGGLENTKKVYNSRNVFFPDIYGGIKEINCSNLLKDYFRYIRKNAK